MINLREDQRAALLALDDAVIARGAPCRENPYGWDEDVVSTDPDALEQACTACRSCPALAECTTYAATRPRVFGVLAARPRGLAGRTSRSADARFDATARATAVDRYLAGEAANRIALDLHVDDRAVRAWVVEAGHVLRTRGDAIRLGKARRPTRQPAT